VVILESVNGTNFVIVRLRHVPIRGSIKLGVESGSGFKVLQPPEPMSKSDLMCNLVAAQLVGYDLSNTDLILEYMRDERYTNVIKNIRALNRTTVLLDGNVCPLRWNEKE